MFNYTFLSGGLAPILHYCLLIKPCDLFQFVKCKIIKKQAKVLDVELLPSKIKAVLPKMHLSDSVEMCEALWDMYKEGDILNEVMYLNKTTNAVSYIVLTNFTLFMLFLTKWANFLFNENTFFFFKKSLSGKPSEYQTVWIQIRTHIMSSLIWVQIDCTGYQQMKLDKRRNEAHLDKNCST